MPYGDPPNSAQERILRDVLRLGGVIDKRTLPLYPTTGNALKGKGYLEECGIEIGPRGGVYVQLRLTELAKTFFEKHPIPGSGSREQIDVLINHHHYQFFAILDKNIPAHIIQFRTRNYWPDVAEARQIVEGRLSETPCPCQWEWWPEEIDVLSPIGFEEARAKNEWLRFK